MTPVHDMSAAQDAEGDSTDSSDDEVMLPAGNRDGTRSSAHAHELKIAASLAKDPWGRCVCVHADVYTVLPLLLAEHSPPGIIRCMSFACLAWPKLYPVAKGANRARMRRFGGRDGKMARIKAQEAALAAAALCAAPASSARGADSAGPGPGSAAVQAAEAGAKGRAKRIKREDAQQPKVKRLKAAARAEPPAGDGNAQLTDGRKKKAKRREAKQEAAASEGAAALEPPAKGSAEQGAAHGRTVHAVHVPATAAQHKFTPMARSGWWGAGRFTSAGCLEGLEHTAQHVALERKQFTEDTQEALYTAVQGAKAANKKGLGSSSAIRKPNVPYNPGAGTGKPAAALQPCSSMSYATYAQSRMNWLVRS